MTLVTPAFTYIGFQPDRCDPLQKCCQAAVDQGLRTMEISATSTHLHIIEFRPPGALLKAGETVAGQVLPQQRRLAGIYPQMIKSAGTKSSGLIENGRNSLRHDMLTDGIA